MNYDAMLPRLYETIVAVCPIDGVSMVNSTITPPTVRIDYSTNATQAQKNAANTALASFDWSQAAQDTWEAQKRSTVIGATNVALVLADKDFTLNTYQDMTDLGFQLAANERYIFEFKGTYHASKTSTGIQLALAGPTFSFLVATIEGYVSTSSPQLATIRDYDIGLNNTGSAGPVSLPFSVYGNLNTTAAGLLRLRVRSEVAGEAVTIEQGSCGTLQVLQ